MEKNLKILLPHAKAAKGAKVLDRKILGRKIEQSWYAFFSYSADPDDACRGLISEAAGEGGPGAMAAMGARSA